MDMDYLLAALQLARAHDFYWSWTSVMPIFGGVAHQRV